VLLLLLLLWASFAMLPGLHDTDTDCVAAAVSGGMMNVQDELLGVLTTA
jgi:hypothetical protein